MPTDGDFDYRTLSLAQLREALDAIDRDRYPQNYAHLVRELEARPPDPPPGSVLPEALVLSSPSSLQAGVGAGIVFLAVSGAGAIGLLGWPQVIYSHFSPALLATAPRVLTAWGFVLVMGWTGISALRTSRKTVAITLVRDQLQVSGWTGTETIPLDAVSRVQWLRRPSADTSGLAELTLTGSSSLGQTLTFYPTSEDGFRQLVEIVEYREGQRMGRNV